MIGKHGRARRRSQKDYAQRQYRFGSYAFDPKAGDRGKLVLKSYNVTLYDEDLVSDEPSRTSEAERRSEEAHAGKHAAQTRKQRAVGKKAAMTTKGRAALV